MTGNSPFGRSSFLHELAIELDPPLDRKQLARERYEDLGRWLHGHAAQTADRDVQVYPQGSGNLGTTDRDPFTGEFDIDLVIRVRYGKWELSQQRLNQIINGWLGSYVSVRQESGHRLAPIKLDKGKRAWTLYYEDGFHMDVLPVVPDLADELGASIGDPSWLTDKALLRWQPTNPRGFARWFRGISAAERYERKIELAKRADVEVDQLPDDRVRTSLQLTVQLLKRHRDYMSRDEPDGIAPPSAMITALASRAYDAQTPSGGDLANVIEAVVADMPQHVHRTSSRKLWIPNPACSLENYADRYDNQSKEEALESWLQRARDDFSELTSVRNAARISKAIDDAFGPGLGSRIAEKIGRETQQLRTLGMLGSTAAGGLAADVSSSHRPHRFYGQHET